MDLQNLQLEIVNHKFISWNNFEKFAYIKEVQKKYTLDFNEKFLGASRNFCMVTERWSWPPSTSINHIVVRL